MVPDAVPACQSWSVDLSMIRFHCLGSVDLLDQDGETIAEVVSQPKLVALLSYVALLNHGGFVPRDRLLGAFWPESDADRARGSLNQALYQLRSALGEGIIEARGKHDLRLVRGVVWCDALAFQEAAAGGHVERAAEIYRGELLEGLYASDDFNRWLDEERARLRRLFCDVAWRRAEEAEASGDNPAALRMARAATSKSPFDEQALRRLMELLDRLGDRAGAVHAYREFARRLQNELEMYPSAETRALAERLRSSAVTGRGAESAPPTKPASEKTTRKKPAAGAGSAWDPGRHGAEGPRSIRRLFPPLALAAIIGVLTIVVALGFANRSSVTATELSLAVLPLANLSDAADDEYLALGLTDEIITRLGRITDLRVTSRPSIMQYLDTEKDAPTIADELGVRYLLAGSVQASEGQLRVRVQLIDGVRDRPLWTDTFEATRRDFFAVQSQIASRVASSIRVTLGPTELAAIGEPPTGNPDAYLHYLRARALRMEGTRGTSEQEYLREAAERYQRAIDADPDFALAYAEMSANAAVRYWLYDREEEVRRQARLALDRAEALNSEHPRVRLARAQYLYHVEQHYDDALAIAEDLKSALPNDRDRLYIVAMAHRRQKRFELAADEIGQLIAVDPLAGRFHYELYATSRRLRRPEAMRRTVERMVTLEYGAPEYRRFRLASELGDIDGSRAVLDEALAVRGPSWCILCQLDQSRWDRDYERMLDVVEAGPPDRIINEQGFHFPIERGRWQALWLRGDTAEARSVATRWLPFMEEHGGWYVAEAYAYAGRGDDAVGSLTAGWGGPDEPIWMKTDKWAGENRARELLARILVVVGRHDDAIDELEKVLEMDRYPWVNGLDLRMEPWWDPIRHLPRFRVLQARYDSTDASHGWDVDSFSRQIDERLTALDPRWTP